MTQAECALNLYEMAWYFIDPILDPGYYQWPYNDQAHPLILAVVNAIENISVREQPSMYEATFGLRFPDKSLLYIATGDSACLLEEEMLAEWDAEIQEDIRRENSHKTVVIGLGWKVFYSKTNE